MMMHRGGELGRQQLMRGHLLLVLVVLLLLLMIRALVILAVFHYGGLKH
jgi:hypothetical protein